MRKFIISFVSVLTLVLCLFLVSCKDKNDLTPYISELREKVYYGETENYKVKCFYGFKESPYIADGKVGNLIYGLTFKLLDRQLDNASFTLNFSHNDNTYRTAFELNEISHCLEAFVELNEFNLTEFDIDISSSSFVENVKLTNIIPKDTINYKTALKTLSSASPSLIGKYFNENNSFIGEIHIRVLVKDDKPYWYIGLIDNAGSLKALLINGTTGEVLAVRSVI